jgi:hypothetical protein
MPSLDGWVTPVLLLFLGAGVCLVFSQMQRATQRAVQKKR